MDSPGIAYNSRTKSIVFSEIPLVEITNGVRYAPIMPITSIRNKYVIIIDGDISKLESIIEKYYEELNNADIIHIIYNDKNQPTTAILVLDETEKNRLIAWLSREAKGVYRVRV